MSNTAVPARVDGRDPLALRIVDRVSSVAAVGAAVALWALLINVVADVLLRAFTGRPLGLTLELTTYWWMPVLVALSYAITEKRGDHITVTLLLDRLTPRMRRMVDGTFSAIGAALVLLLAWYTGQSAFEAAEVRLMANSNPPLEYWQVKFVACFGLALLGIQLAARSVRQLIDRFDEVAPIEEREGEL